MTEPFSCPDAKGLRRAVMGDVPADEVDQLVKHLETCDRCASLMDTVTGMDSLLEAVRCVKDRPAVPPSPVLQDLMRQLAQSRPESQDATEVMARAAGREGPDLDFLSPPRGPGEIGRLGGYRVLKVLGSGGMGLVLEAEDERLKRRVALKVMRPAVAAARGAAQRFLREAEATAAVRSDHVVTIYQAAEDNGVPFLAMEFLEGRPLDLRLSSEPPPTLAEVLRVGREMALGLAAAHARGLIHRDVKPGNVWLEAPHDRVKILDFGLARAGVENVRLTQSGAIVGTPAYMSPEQGRGEKLDHRSDLFSLGSVLYELCTGQPPFRGESTMAVLTSLALDNPTPVREINSEVPPALESLIMRLLAKSPAARPASASAVAEELAAIERQPVAKPSRKRRWPLIAAAVLVLGLLGAATYLYGVTLVRIVTNKGELVVEVDDPNIEVKVTGGGGVTLVDRTRNRSLVLEASEGQVEFYERGSDVRLAAKEFQLKRGGTVVVNARADVAEAKTAGVKTTGPKVSETKPGVPVEGPRNGALLFDGSSRVSIPDPRPNREPPFTLECWVRPRAASYTFLLHSLSGGLKLWKTGTEDAPEYRWSYVTSDASRKVVSATDSTPPLLDSWTHLAAVWDGKTQALYVNGRLAQKVVAPRALYQPPARDSYQVGTPHPSTPQGFQGEIAEVRFSKVVRYDKEFTPEARFKPDADTLAECRFLKP